MDWQDEGLILGVRRHGETSAIIEMMTENHGRHMGLVRGGRSSRMRPILQPGNSASVTWRARLEEHLGTFSVEENDLRAAALMETPVGIYGIQTLANHLRLLPERDPHINLYNASLVILEHLSEPEIAASLMVRFEITLLEELGFGLDLASCASTGATRELVWVSPKSGRAVSRDAGEPWADKLLSLPDFAKPEFAITGSENMPDKDAIKSGFALSGFFLERHIYTPRGLRPPDERQGFIRAINKCMEQQ